MFGLRATRGGIPSETAFSSQIRMESECLSKVAIAGGGAGGIGVALELANAGYRVDLFEKRAALLSATSNKTPGRAGHGYHYVHQKTAELYLRATIEVVKRYPDCLLGFGHEETHYLRHGLYCIMKQKDDLRADQVEFASIYPKELILQTYGAIKECYRSLVAEDASNQVFGEPDDFHHILSSLEMEKYKDTINLAIVDTIVDTREELLNWPKLRSTLITEVENHPNIKIHYNSTIDSPRQRNDRIGFNFTVNGRLCEADIFINATWEGIEKLNQKIFIHMEPDSRTNRLKTIIRAKLPVNLKEHPSVFFCMGPHAMISNMGDGTVMSTYAQVTNVSSSTGLFISEKAQQCLDGLVNFEEEVRMADEIIEGVSQYFPSMRSAKIINKGYGIIKTRGTVDLFDPNSEVNKREEIGVEEQLIGWIDNACMKLLHFILNGREVLDLVRKTEYAQKTIRVISTRVLSELYPIGYDQVSMAYPMSIMKEALDETFTTISFDCSPSGSVTSESISVVSDPLLNLKINVLTNMLSMVLQRYTRSGTFEGTEHFSNREILNKIHYSLFNSMSAKNNAMRAIQGKSSHYQSELSVCTEPPTFISSPLETSKHDRVSLELNSIFNKYSSLKKTDKIFSKSKSCDTF